MAQFPSRITADLMNVINQRSQLSPSIFYWDTVGDVADIILMLSKRRGHEPINSLCNNSSDSFLSAEESDCLTEYEEDGMDTVREEDGEEEDAGGHSSAE